MSSQIKNILRFGWILIVFFVVISWFSGCDLLFGKQEGALVLHFDGTDSRSVLLTPDFDMELDSITIAATGPGNTTFTETLLTDSKSFIREGLAAGTWEITVKGHNEAGDVITEPAVLEVEIMKNKVTAATAGLYPVEGVGNFNVTVAWEDTESKITDPQVKMTIYDKDRETIIRGPDVLDQESGLFESSGSCTLESGWYEVNLGLYEQISDGDDEELWLDSYALRIVAGEETHAEVTIEEKDIDFLIGELNLTIQPELANPFTVAFTSLAEFVEVDEQVSLEASGSFGNDASFRWYINGALQDSTSRIFDYTFSQVGNYRITLLVSDNGALSGHRANLEVNSSDTFYGYTFDYLYGGRGGGEGLFHGPTDIAVDTEGSIYVADRLNSRVQKFTPEGTFESFLTVGGYEAYQTHLPVGLAIDANDNVYIADDSVMIFDSTGAFIRRWWGEDSAEGSMRGPAGIDVTPDGSAVYVSEHDADRVRKFDASGNQLASWGSTGTGEGQFKSPSGLALDTAGNVYVVDIENFRIQKFQPDGTFISSWTFTDDENTGWPVLYDIHIEGDDLYVSDVRKQVIQHYNLEGEVQNTISLLSGDGNGEFSEPHGLAMNQDSDIVVVDSRNHRVQVLETDGTYVS